MRVDGFHPYNQEIFGMPGGESLEMVCRSI